MIALVTGHVIPHESITAAKSMIAVARDSVSFILIRLRPSSRGRRNRLGMSAANAATSS